MNYVYVGWLMTFVPGVVLANALGTISPSEVSAATTPEKNPLWVAEVTSFQEDGPLFVCFEPHFH